MPIGKITCSTYIYITTQFPAYHKWDKAPIEVAFLRTYHRHMFHVLIYWEVTHDDREMEFFLMKQGVDKFLDENWKETYIDNMSCEMMAKVLLQEMDADEVQVSEDDENGAVAQRTYE